MTAGQFPTSGASFGRQGAGSSPLPTASKRLQAPRLLHSLLLATLSDPLNALSSQACSGSHGASGASSPVFARRATIFQSVPCTLCAKSKEV